MIIHGFQGEHRVRTSTPLKAPLSFLVLSFLKCMTLLPYWYPFPYLLATANFLFLLVFITFVHILDIKGGESLLCLNSTIFLQMSVLFIFTYTYKVRKKWSPLLKKKISEIMWGLSNTLKSYANILFKRWDHRILRLE